MIQKLEFRAMGSKILVAVDSTDKKALETAHQVPFWFEEWENIFSRFRPESELSRLNRSDGKPFTASKDLLEVLSLARRARSNTLGAVTPLVLDALIHNGYASNFDSPYTVADSLRAGNMPLPPDTADFEIDENAAKVILPSGVHIDLGGFAKGWAAHTAMNRIATEAPCLVNAGGDIAVGAAQVDGKPWLIGVENPLAPEENVALVELTGKGIATSGKDYRRWIVNGEIKHHLIDPWTGLPAVSDVYSATVIAANVIKAEEAGKAAIIMGSKNGREWLDRQEELAYLLQLENGEIIVNSRFESYLWSANGSKHQD